MDTQGTAENSIGEKQPPAVYIYGPAQVDYGYAKDLNSNDNRPRKDKQEGAIWVRRR
jgi:hypothetical protein